MKNNTTQSGNVLFLILIAVALFAGLSYVITHSSRSGSGSISNERQRLDTARVENYITAINTGLLRLSLVPCNIVDYTPPSGWGAEDKKCHLFHPYGGAVIYQDFDMGDGFCAGTAKPWVDLAVGEGCNGLVYAGISGSDRLYTTPVVTGSGGYGPDVLIGASSTTDGFSNTEIMLAAGVGHVGATLCRSLGPKWYMPARLEFDVLWASKDTGAMIGTFTGYTRYISSTESSFNRKPTFIPGSGNWTSNNSQGPKHIGGGIRCVRKD